MPAPVTVPAVNIAPTTTVALNTDQAKAVGIVAIVALVVAGVVVSAIVTALIVRIVTILIVLALALLVWTQRSDITAAAKRCDASFFGIHLTPSNPAVNARCRDVTNR